MTVPKVNVRRATLYDAWAIFRLHRELTAHEVSTMSDPHYPDRIEDDKEAWAMWFPEFTEAVQGGSFWLVGEIDGQPEGYRVAYPNIRNFGLPKRFLECAECYVRQSHRNTSLGFRLIRAVERYGKSIGATHMELSALNNEQQSGQFEKAGWRPYMKRMYKRIR